MNHFKSLKHILRNQKKETEHNQNTVYNILRQIT